MRERNSTNPQRNPGPKLMRIKAVANANRWSMLVCGWLIGSWHYESVSARALQVKLRQLHISRGGNFDVLCRSHHHCDSMPCSFRQRSLICAQETVCRCLIENFLDHAVTKPLRCLRHHHARA